MANIDFEVVVNGLTYRDTIVYDETNPPTEEQIEEIKQQRADRWYTTLMAARPAPTPLSERPPRMTREQMAALEDNQE